MPGRAIVSFWRLPKPYECKAMWSTTPVYGGQQQPFFEISLVALVPHGTVAHLLPHPCRQCVLGRSTPLLFAFQERGAALWNSKP